MKLTREDYSIALDAHYDLVMAGMPCEPSDIQEFETAYCEAAEELAKELSVNIEVVLCEGCGYESDRTQDCDNDEEGNYLWQAIHDRV